MADDVVTKMREAGKVQSDPALTAIQDLGDSVAASFNVLEKESKLVRDEALTAVKETKDELEQLKTEVAAGFKIHGEKLNTMDRRSVAIGYQGMRDVTSACLAALQPEQKRWISQMEWNMASATKDREKYPVMSNPVAKTAAALWFVASTRTQLRRGTRQELENDYATMERIEKAFRDAFQNEIAATLVTGTPALGGNWLPEPVAGELYRLIQDNSVMSPLVSHVTMETLTLDLPTEGTGISVTWGPEATPVIVDSMGSTPIAKATLTAQRLNGYAEVSIEQLQDSPISMMGWVQLKLTELMGREIDKTFLEGVASGAQLFTGLATAAGVNVVGTGVTGTPATLIYPDLPAQVFAAKERQSRNGARWFVAPKMAGKLYGMTDAAAGAGQPIVQFGIVPNAMGLMLLGYPLEVHSVILDNRGTGTNSSFIYFGPPSTLVLGDKMGMTWDVSDSFKFQNAIVAMRLITRMGFCIPLPATWTRREFVSQA